MVELLTMWRHTRMVALAALCAALYAAVLIPFKPIPIIPGITELRPANALPVVFSMMFGPAAAWGSAFGNTVADFFGTIGPGSIFGFIGNFFLGYAPYRVWRVLTDADPEPAEGARSAGHFAWWGIFLTATLLGGVACALFIAWPVHLLGLAPFLVVGPVISVNNFVMGAALAPLLLVWIYPRARRMGLAWREVMDEEDLRDALAGRIGLVLALVGTLGGLVMGIAGHFLWGPEPSLAWAAATGPFVAAALAGLALL